MQTWIYILIFSIFSQSIAAGSQPRTKKKKGCSPSRDFASKRKKGPNQLTSDQSTTIWDSILARHDLHPALREEAIAFIERALANHPTQKKGGFYDEIGGPKDRFDSLNQKTLYNELHQITSGANRRQEIRQQLFDLKARANAAKQKGKISESDYKEYCLKILNLITDNPAFVPWGMTFDWLGNNFNLESHDYFIATTTLFEKVKSDKWAKNSIERSIIENHMDSSYPESQLLMIAYIANSGDSMQVYEEVLDEFISSTPDEDDEVLSMLKLASASILYSFHQQAFFSDQTLEFARSESPIAYNLALFIWPHVLKNYDEDFLLKLGKTASDQHFLVLANNSQFIRKSFTHRILKLFQEPQYQKIAYNSLELLLSEESRIDFEIPDSFFNIPLASHSRQVRIQLLHNSSISQLLHFIFEKTTDPKIVQNEIAPQLYERLKKDFQKLEFQEDQLEYLVSQANQANIIGKLARLLLIAGGISDDIIFSKVLSSSSPEELMTKEVLEILSEIPSQRVLRHLKMNKSSHFLGSLIGVFAKNLIPKDRLNFVREIFRDSSGNLFRKNLINSTNFRLLTSDPAVQQILLSDFASDSDVNNAIALHMSEAGQSPLPALIDIGANLRKLERADRRSRHLQQPTLAKESPTKNETVTNKQNQEMTQKIFSNPENFSTQEIIAAIISDLNTSVHVNKLSRAFELLSLVELGDLLKLSSPMRDDLAQSVLNIIGANRKSSFRLSALEFLIKLTKQDVYFESYLEDALSSYYSSSGASESIDPLLALCLSPRESLAMIAFSVLQEHLKLVTYKGLPSLKTRQRVVQAFSIFAQSESPPIKAILASLLFEYAGRLTDDLEQAAGNIDGLHPKIALFVAGSHSLDFHPLTKSSTNPFWMPLYNDEETKWPTKQISFYHEAVNDDDLERINRAGERIGMTSAIIYELQKGRIPIDVSITGDPGYDIYSIDFRTGMILRIEVKGKYTHSESTFSFTHHQLKTVHQIPHDFKIYLVNINVEHYTSTIDFYGNFQDLKNLEASVVPGKSNHLKSVYKITGLKSYRIPRP